jgi:two-component system, cell cycle sensor histidine kinase and response regulator CckA
MPWLRPQRGRRHDRPIGDRETAQEPPRAGSGEAVLLVEDDPGVGDLGRRMLSRLGYRVWDAPNGAAALILAQETGPIDLLMTDVVMPGMTGRELAKALLAIHPETKVLFTSGYTEEVIVHHGVLEADIHFIGKPYSMPSLARKVRDVLAGRTPGSGTVV